MSTAIEAAVTAGNWYYCRENNTCPCKLTGTFRLKCSCAKTSQLVLGFAGAQCDFF